MPPVVARKTTDLVSSLNSDGNQRSIKAANKQSNLKSLDEKRMEIHSLEAAKERRSGCFGASFGTLTSFEHFFLL